ncbi:MAG TPA: hypothetical protein VEI50_02505 [Nitrospiraceae bacterium]|nr:hypothetical protein [Nitrospiraceae bacterium]
MPRWVLITACLSLLIGCASLKDQYLDKSIGKATQEDIVQQFGLPTEERELPTGGRMWLYRFKRYSPVASSSVCDGYELQFDDQKILTQWNRFSCGDRQISDAGHGELTQRSILSL